VCILASRLRAISDCGYLPWSLHGVCTSSAFGFGVGAAADIDSEHAQLLSHCDVALFKGKGELDDAEEMRHDLPGIVHRSPRREGSGISSLVLVIDIPQEGWHY